MIASRQSFGSAFFVKPILPIQKKAQKAPIINFTLAKIN
jgi:hypothetical protein